MRCLVSAVYMNSGTSSKTGQPFSLPRANVSVPFQGRESPNYQVRGVGLSSVEMTVSDAFYSGLLKEFQAGFNGMPLAMDFETSMDYEGKNVLVGFAKPVAQSSDLSKKFG